MFRGGLGLLELLSEWPGNIGFIESNRVMDQTAFDVALEILGLGMSGVHDRQVKGQPTRAARQTSSRGTKQQRRIMRPISLFLSPNNFRDDPQGSIRHKRRAQRDRIAGDGRMYE